MKDQTSYLEIGDVCPQSFYPRIGGSCALPKNINWPRSQTGEPCLLFLSADSTWIVNNAEIELPENMVLSVFVPFDPNSIDHSSAMARVSNSAKALLHTKETFYRQECLYPIEPPRQLVIERGNSPETVFSEIASEIEPKIGGDPTWLQNKIEIPGRSFVLQMMAHQIRKHWPSHSPLLMGGVVYLFLDTHWNQREPLIGELRLQYT